MDTTHATGANEPVYDFRQLLGQKKSAGRKRGTFRLVPEFLVEVLERSAVLLVAVCLCFVIAGFAWLMVRKPLTDSEAITQPEPQLSQPAFTEFNSQKYTLEYPPETGESFMIRVGSFRDPSNARRVAESLEQRHLDVRTDVRAGGLHVVTLGPYMAKDAAEDAARGVKQILGLTPQVLRQSGQ
jgi:hypothetical protein